jgi:hypothetical protein
VPDTERITRVIEYQFKILNKDRTATHNRFFDMMNDHKAEISEIKVALAKLEPLDGRLCDVEDDVDGLKTAKAHLKGAVAAVASVISLAVSGLVWLADRGRGLW